MLKTNSYDTVCHEHLEFYSLRQIQWMAAKVGFKILDVEFNDVNGGSFSVTVKKESSAQSVLPAVQELLDREIAFGLSTLAPYQQFAQRVEQSRQELLAFLAKAKIEGKSVAAIGASTKGNVLLQYCGLSANEIEFVGEVNPDKFGSYTPGSWIPIISEEELLAMEHDYLVVLPWHFRPFFEFATKLRGRTLVFPLPTLVAIDPESTVLK